MFAYLVDGSSAWFRVLLSLLHIQVKTNTPVIKKKDIGSLVGHLGCLFEDHLKLSKIFNLALQAKQGRQRELIGRQRKERDGTKLYILNPSLVWALASESIISAAELCDNSFTPCLIINSESFFSTSCYFLILFLLNPSFACLSTIGFALFFSLFEIRYKHRYKQGTSWREAGWCPFRLRSTWRTCSRFRPCGWMSTRDPAEPCEMTTHKSMYRSTFTHHSEYYQSIETHTVLFQCLKTFRPG